MAIKSNVPLLTSVNLLSGFGDNQVSQVVEHASKMFSLASVYEYVDIWHASVAIEILYVLNVIFGDIDYNFEDEQLDDCSSQYQILICGVLMTMTLSTVNFLQQRTYMPS